jgi:hypothetical protein
MEGHTEKISKSLENGFELDYQPLEFQFRVRGKRIPGTLTGAPVFASQNLDSSEFVGLFGIITHVKSRGLNHEIRVSPLAHCLLALDEVASKSIKL